MNARSKWNRKGVSPRLPLGKQAAWRHLWITAAVILPACTVGPDYRPPETQMPSSWAEMPPAMTTTAPTTAPSRATSQPAAIADWWRSLRDPRLDALVAQAMKSNLDLRVAEARVREARALRGIIAADYWPQVNVAGSYAYKGNSENAMKYSGSSGPGLGKQAGGAAVSSAVRAMLTPGQTPAGVAGAAISGAASTVVTNAVTGSGGGGSFFAHSQNLYVAGFDASWELDVFGRIRRDVEAADADVAATEDSRCNTIVTLLAEVALNYVQAREFQQRLAIARASITSQKDSLQLAQTRFKAGLTSELDVTQAKAQLATTQSQIPRLEASLRQTIHRIGVLIGREPSALLPEFQEHAPIPTVPPEVPIGLPSELLRRRPDIRRAERELAAATARIGAATADLFPRFSLTGSFGPQAAEIGHMLDWKSFAWSVGPSVRWPVFDGWRIRSNIKAQDARQEQALALYEKTVLIALMEVEDALVGYANEQVRHQSLAEAVESNRRSLDLSQELYGGGLIAFLNVLEAQRALYATEDQLAQSESSVVGSLIALYKALGGGWEAPS